MRKADGLPGRHHRSGKRQASARAVLAFPFDHPVIEEGLRTALRQAALRASDDELSLEVLRCGDAMEALRAER